MNATPQVSERATRWWWCSADSPGAVAVACVQGDPPALDALLRTLTGAPLPREDGVAWRRFLPAGAAGEAFDDGVVARVEARTLLLMPHGGMRVRTLLQEALRAAGAVEGTAEHTTDHAAALARARAIYPEAADDVEALALATLARAVSPRAVDLLLAQPERWRAALARGEAAPWNGAELEPTARERALARLVTPARVVVTGPANAGKSTLLNRLAGRALAVVHDQPGTTRDAIAARLDLDGVVVDWFDTPGVRAGADAIEIHAAQLAGTLLREADLVVQLTAPGLGFHTLPGDAPEAPVLRVLNKCDLSAAASCAEQEAASLSISAHTGQGIAELVLRVRRTLVPQDALEAPAPWRFNPALSFCYLGAP